MIKTLKLKNILNAENKFVGWLYIKDPRINLGSDCFFYKVDLNLSPEEEDEVRQQLIADGWRPTLSAEDVEDVIGNVSEQLEKPNMEDLLEAFIFYLENDAFKEWD